MTMLANQEFPQILSIVGIVTEDEPESQSWEFEKAADGQGYSYDQEEVVTNGLPAVAGTEFVSMADFVEFVENCIAYFGPDESELDSPAFNFSFPNNTTGNSLNGMQRAEGNAAGSSGNNAAGSFVGGRRRRNVTRRRSQRRKVSRRKVSRRKVSRRRRASQRRRY